MKSNQSSMREAVRRWSLLAAWAAAIWCFVFVVAPLLGRIGPVRTMSKFVRESGIDAGAVYYTEVEEFAVAEHAVREAMRGAVKD